MKTSFEGGCLCGAVRYRYRGPLREVVGCHCAPCRRTSGHFVAATQGERRRLTLEREDGLRWYESSPAVFRGFCRECGSSLFWTRGGSDRMSIMAGSLDGPTGLALTRHIHVADAGDYYAIDPDLPRAEHWADPPAIPVATAGEEET